MDEKQSSNIIKEITGLNQILKQRLKDKVPHKKEKENNESTKMQSKINANEFSFNDDEQIQPERRVTFDLTNGTKHIKS